jgi:outer membrane protein assembly factor BamD
VVRHLRGRASILISVALISAFSLSACSGRRRPQISYEERPVELLYQTGAQALDRRRWDDAVQYFDEVERQHPYSEWARRSILMQAYAYYESNAYEDAIAAADRFIALYPGNASAAYAYYLKALCYFEQIVDVGRDQAATEQARNALMEVARRYPESAYAQDARIKLDMVNDQLAGKEMTVGRYYLRHGQPLAGIGRFKAVVDRYQTTSHAPEALYRLVEGYLTLGLMDEARRNGAVLGHNYPGDRWYQMAYALLTSRGLRPEVSPRRQTVSAPAPAAPSAPLPPPPAS